MTAKLPLNRWILGKRNAMRTKPGNYTTGGPKLGRLTRVVASGVAAFALAACTTAITKHGTQFAEEDVAQVSAGMSQDQVKQVLGSPATVAAVGRGNAYYYISSTMKQTAFFKPDEVDRQVVAIYFTQTGQVERVANYGMKDGKVFDFVSRTTPSANTNDQSLIQQMFRNLGQKQLFGN